MKKKKKKKRKSGLRVPGPWKKVSALDIAASIDAYMTLDTRAAPASGRVFEPVDSITLGSVLMDSVLMDVVPAEEREEAEEILWGLGELELLARYGGKRRLVFEFRQMHSMVSGTWSLNEFALGNRGYLFEIPDEGKDPLQIMGAWEPRDDAVARRGCILSVYAREWSACGWPPFPVSDAIDKDDMLYDAVLTTFNTHYVCGSILDQISENIKSIESEARRSIAIKEAIDHVVAVSKQPVSMVSSILGAIAGDQEELLKRIRKEGATKEERQILAALLVYSLTCYGF